VHAEASESWKRFRIRAPGATVAAGSKQCSGPREPSRLDDALIHNGVERSLAVPIGNALHGTDKFRLQLASCVSNKCTAGLDRAASLIECPT
jgi:hypothetical protein